MLIQIWNWNNKLLPDNWICDFSVLWKAGKRQLVSWDLDSLVDFVQFYIQIGGESSACNKPDSREEGVLLQYSNNGASSGTCWQKCTSQTSANPGNQLWLPSIDFRKVKGDVAVV